MSVPHFAARRAPLVVARPPPTGVPVPGVCACEASKVRMCARALPVVRRASVRCCCCVRSFNNAIVLVRQFGCQPAAAEAVC